VKPQQTLTTKHTKCQMTSSSQHRSDRPTKESAQGSKFPDLIANLPLTVS